MSCLERLSEQTLGRLHWTLATAAILLCLAAVAAVVFTDGILKWVLFTAAPVCMLGSLFPEAVLEDRDVTDGRWNAVWFWGLILAIVYAGSGLLSALGVPHVHVVMWVAQATLVIAMVCFTIAYLAGRFGLGLPFEPTERRGKWIAYAGLSQMVVIVLAGEVSAVPQWIGGVCGLVGMGLLFIGWLVEQASYSGPIIADRHDLSVAAVLGGGALFGAGLAAIGSGQELGTLGAVVLVTGLVYLALGLAHTIGSLAISKARSVVA